MVLSVGGGSEEARRLTRVCLPPFSLPALLLLLLLLPLCYPPPPSAHDAIAAMPFRTASHANNSVREGDILCLLEWEREARRLR